jgi:hypothetical protein
MQHWGKLLLCSLMITFLYAGFGEAYNHEYEPFRQIGQGIGTSALVIGGGYLFFKAVCGDDGCPLKRIVRVTVLVQHVL